jgi:hypothetical protein
MRRENGCRTSREASFFEVVTCDHVSGNVTEASCVGGAKLGCPECASDVRAKSEKECSVMYQIEPSAVCLTERFLDLPTICEYELPRT